MSRVVEVYEDSKNNSYELHEIDGKNGKWWQTSKNGGEETYTQVIDLHPVKIGCIITSRPTVKCNCKSYFFRNKCKHANHILSRLKEVDKKLLIKIMEQEQARETYWSKHK